MNVSDTQPTTFEWPGFEFVISGLILNMMQIPIALDFVRNTAFMKALSRVDNLNESEKRFVLGQKNCVFHVEAWKTIWRFRHTFKFSIALLNLASYATIFPLQVLYGIGTVNYKPGSAHFILAIFLQYLHLLAIGLLSWVYYYSGKYFENNMLYSTFERVRPSGKQTYDLTSSQLYRTSLIHCCTQTLFTVSLFAISIHLQLPLFQITRAFLLFESVTSIAISVAGHRMMKRMNNLLSFRKVAPDGECGGRKNRDSKETRAKLELMAKSVTILGVLHMLMFAAVVSQAASTLEGVKNIIYVRFSVTELSYAFQVNVRWLQMRKVLERKRELVKHATEKRVKSGSAIVIDENGSTLFD